MAKERIGAVQKLVLLFFRVPGPWASLACLLVGSAFLAVSASGLSSTVFMAFAISAVLASEAAVPMCRGLGRGRSYQLSFLSMFFAGFFYLFLRPFPPVLLLALVFAFRSVALRAFAGVDFFRSLLPAAAHSLLLMAFYGAYAPLGFVSFLVFSAAALAALEAVLRFSGAPLRRVFGEGLVRVAYLVFSNVGSGSNEIECLFKGNSVRARALVSVIGIRAGKGLKALIAAPFVHPGPFGRVGSAGMPQEVCAELGRQFGCEVFFAKGGCTHDDNLASSSDIPRISKKAAGLVRGLSFHGRATCIERSGGASAFRFGGAVLGISTLAPLPTGDVEAGAGRCFVRAMEKNAKKAAYIEAHNSFSAGDSPVAEGSPRFLGLLGDFAAVSERLAVLRQRPLYAGVARVPAPLSASEGMGAGGVGVVLFRAGGAKFALVFVDSNNVAAGVRERIMAAFRRRGVRETEVISSDSHRINTLLERENPLCSKGGVGPLIDSCLKCLKRAEVDLVRCSIGMESGFAGVSVFGPGSSAKILRAVNSAAIKLGAAFLFLTAIPILAGAMV